MIEKVTNDPFGELPEALVEGMLNQCDELGETLSNSFRELFERKSEIRKDMLNQNLLKKDTEILSAPTHPTTCGVDGSYAIEKLLFTDMVAMAGVAVEGLTPPTEKRYWPEPRHLSNVLTIAHSDSTRAVAGAIMMCMELELAAKAPHDVIFLDGSLITPFIHFIYAFDKIDEVSDNLSSLFYERLETALESYKKILLSKRTDKMFVGIPKYTTTKEIAQRVLRDDTKHEDRGFLSLILDAREFVGPVEIQQPTLRLRIDRPPANMGDLIEEIIIALENLYVIYYRPSDHFPALRMEISPSIAANTQRLAILFESLQLQCGAPGIMEPYPIYLADRMVKHLRTALPAIRKTTTQEMSLKWGDALGIIYLAMHGYRTEWGK